jgi:flavin reductase (DIM6/NTAB) family NADH-FMN oxidoreductase RutF
MTALVDPGLFKEAMRQTASGVAVIATDGPAGRAGATVSSLCSLSMDPPSVLVCIHAESRALPPLLENSRFTANILSHGQERVADVFAGLVPELRERRFSEGAWGDLPSGLPGLEGALCCFECRVASVFRFGSHQIVAGEVFGLKQGATSPLIFSDRRYHRLAGLDPQDLAHA